MDTWSLLLDVPTGAEAVSYMLPQSSTSSSTTNQQDNREIEYTKASLERAFRLAMHDYTVSLRQLQRCPSLWHGVKSAGLEGKEFKLEYASAYG